MGKKPGCMIYFDLRPSLHHLSDAELGQLFRAIMDYSELGVVPELSGMAAFAFDFIRPRLDADNARYENAVVRQRQYAVYVREAKKRGWVPASFDEWKASVDNGSNQPASTDNEVERPITDVIGSYPTTTTTTTTSTTTSSSPPQNISISKSIKKEKGKEGECEGEPPPPPLTKEMPKVGPLSEQDFEKRRQDQLDRFKQYLGTG